MTKIKEAVTKVYEQKAGSDLIQARFEDDILVSLVFAGQRQSASMYSYLSDPTRAYELYQALDLLFKETGLHDKDDRRLKVSPVPGEPSQS